MACLCCMKKPGLRTKILETVFVASAVLGIVALFFWTAVYAKGVTLSEAHSEEANTTSQKPNIDDNASGLLTVNESLNINCSEGFFVINESCRPQCDEWNQYSKSQSYASIAFKLCTACCAIVCGTIFVIIAFVFRRKEMLKYPSVLIVYMTIVYTVQVMIITIAITNRSLFCTSEDLIESLETASIFCKITGISFHYSFVSGFFWWLAHVCAVFHAVVFPFHARSMESKRRYLSFILLGIGLFLPLPPIIISLSSDKYGFIVASFPPVSCAMRHPDLIYYTYVVYMNVVLAIGSCLLVPVFLTIHKHYGLFTNKCIISSAAETKILLILCYYVIFGFVVITFFSIQFAMGESQLQALEQYFLCEEDGVGSDCNNSTMQTNSMIGMELTASVLLGLVPVVNLAYVIQWKSTRDTLKAWIRRIQKHLKK